MEKPLGISGRIAAGFQRNAITPLLALVPLPALARLPPPAPS